MRDFINRTNSSIGQTSRWLLLCMLTLAFAACTSDKAFEETPSNNNQIPTLSSVSVTTTNATAGQAAVGDTITVNITASEAILAPTVTVNGNAASSVSGSGTDWVATYVVTETDTSGGVDLRIDYSDVAGNSGTVVTTATDGSTVSIDVDVPTLEISGQPNNVEAGVPFTVTFTFSEAVNGFDISDIVVTNASVSNFTGADGDTVYTADITPPENEQVDITIASGAAIDTSGNAIAEALVVVPPTPELTLLWSDEFDGTALDATKWNIQTGDGCAEGICGWGNNELQIYTADNITVSGGMLTIEGRQEADSSYTSARINTKGKLDVKFGRIEVNARLPEGQGTWPAIWMLSTDEVYGGWPQSGEIDIIEGFNLGVAGKKTVTSTLHYGLPWPENSFTFSAYDPPFNPQDGFHTYAIEWEADEIRFFVDDVHHATQISDNWYTYDVGSTEPAPNSAPFDQAFHLLLNLAIGGNLPGSPDASSMFPQQLVVDWVRVYECANSDPANGVGCSTADPNIVPVAAPGAPSVSQLEIYTDVAPATITAEVNGISSTNTLQPGGFNNGGATVVSDFDFADPDNAGNSVWHLAISGDLANVFLSSEDKSTDEVLDTGFNLMGGQTLGELIFDMKVNTLSDGTSILIKMDSGFPNVGQFALDNPVVGEWQTYSVRIADLLANPAFVDCCGGTGLNLADVLNLFVFEPSNADFAAIDVDVYLDNIRVEVACKNEGDCTAEPKTKPSTTVNVYDDAVGALWDDGIGGFDSASGFASCYDGASCGGVMGWAEVDAADATRGKVIEVSHIVGTDFAGLFIGASTTQDLSSFDGGTVSFDIQVLDNGGNNGQFFMKVDCVFPCTSGDTPIGVVGASGWETVTVPISQLIGTGLDTSNVNTGLVIFPASGQQSGVKYQLDNIFWDLDGSMGTPLSDAPPSAGITIDGTDPAPAGTDLSIFVDEFATGFSSNFFAADGTVNVMVTADPDPVRGNVIQIESLASQQVTWIEANPVLDLTSYAGGTLEFDIKVIQSPTDPTAIWRVKSECVACGSSIPELDLGGQTVITKDVWHHVSITLDALGYADATQVDKPLVVFPEWGKATGAIYQIDNVRIVAPAGTGPSLSNDPPSAGITVNPSVSTSGGAEEVVYVDGLSAGYIFGQYDDDFTGTTSIMEIDSMDPAYGNVIEVKNGTATKVVSWVESSPTRDLTAYADGVLEFDMYVVDAPANPEAIWKVKAECGDPACGAIELVIGGQTLLPPGQWHHVVVSVPSLAITDLATLKNVVIFNDWTNAAGSTYWVDNIVWKEIADTTTTTGGAKVLFDEALASGYFFAQYDNQFTGTPTMETVDSMDPAHGMVIEINNGSSTEIVSWVGNDSPGEDLTALASGSLDFDFYVDIPPDDATANYLVKIETEPCPSGCTATLDYTFASQTDITPGQWYSFSIPMADLGISDITKFRNVVFFNEWGKAAGTIMRVDNLEINP